MLNTVNIICEGLLLILFSIMMEKRLLLKYIPISRLECKNHTLFITKMAETSLNLYPIYDQNSWKTIPFGAAHTYIAHIREYPRAISFKVVDNTSLLALSFCSCWQNAFSTVHQGLNNSSFALRWALVNGNVDTCSYVWPYYIQLWPCRLHSQCCWCLGMLCYSYSWLLQASLVNWILVFIEFKWQFVFGFFVLT